MHVTLATYTYYYHTLNNTQSHALVVRPQGPRACPKPGRLDHPGQLRARHLHYHVLLVTYMHTYTPTGVGRTRGGVVNAPGYRSQRVQTRVISGLPGPRLGRCLNHGEPHRM